MNITAVAQSVSLTVKALRYYERLGLVVPERSANGYRQYSQQDIAALRFVARARGAGFSVEETAQLLALYRNPVRQSREVKALAQEKLRKLGHQIDELQAIKRQLGELVAQCPGDKSPDCAIISGLSDHEQ